MLRHAVNVGRHCTLACARAKRCIPGWRRRSSGRQAPHNVMGCGPFDVDPVVLRELSLAEPVRVVGFAEERVSQFTREG